MQHTRKEEMEAVGRLLEVMDTLREKCPWDHVQTNQTLKANTIEEAYELYDALSEENNQEICKELGDVLLHVVFYSVIGREKQAFDIVDVCDKCVEKLKFRHPHIYGNVEVSSSKEVEDNWEKIKQKEKDGNKTVLSGVPKALPSLIKAYRIQDKARHVGFDWKERSQVWDKIKEEISEFEAEVAQMDADKTEAEFGDVLFSLVNAARLYDINPDNALERTNRKFISRFTSMETKIKADGKTFKGMSLAEMDKYWEKAKLEKQTK